MIERPNERKRQKERERQEQEVKSNKKEVREDARGQSKCVHPCLLRSRRPVPTYNEVPVEMRECIFCRLVHKEIHLSLAHEHSDFHVESRKLVLPSAVT